MATSQPAELALQSRHSMAVASTSSLGIRLQPRSHAGLPGADAGAWHGAGGEQRAVTANASPTGGRAAGAGLLEGVLCPAWSTGASSTLRCLKLSDGPLLLT